MSSANFVAVLAAAVIFTTVATTPAETCSGNSCEDEVALLQTGIKAHVHRLSTSSTDKNCTGDEEVDAILAKADMEKVTKMINTARSPAWERSVYTWEGFCSAVRVMKDAGSPLYEGKEGTDKGPKRVAKVLANIASLLSQCAWESGGEAPWSACDENNHLGTATAPCTQRADKERYDSLTDAPACAVDKDMHMVAKTQAAWAAKSPPMSCVPNTDTAGCCWWGRGAIQTTGPHNYKSLQDAVVSKSATLEGVDLCLNPEAMCEKEDLKWLGALHYWTSAVQVDKSFETSLDSYVSSGFDDASSVVDHSSFNGGTGAVVNNGQWSQHAHGDYGRMKYFHEYIDALKKAGMGENMEFLAVTTPPPGPERCDLCRESGHKCYVAGWGSPCFNPTDETECSGYSGEWCETPPTGCQACRADGKTCHVSSWGSPCFAPADKASCAAHSGEWCLSEGCDKCNAASKSCFVKGWGVPCFAAAEQSICTTHGGEWCK
jgi:predicted chitinase